MRCLWIYVFIKQELTNQINLPQTKPTVVIFRHNKMLPIKTILFFVSYWFIAHSNEPETLNSEWVDKKTSTTQHYYQQEEPLSEMAVQ